MRVYLFAAVACLTFGCRGREQLDAVNPVPMAVVRHVPSSMQNLKAGMPRDEVLAKLGLKPYEVGGFVSLNSEIFQLRQGFNLVLDFDSSGSGKVVRAELAGAGWATLHEKQ
jgi:hypothetical protein